MTRPFHDWLPLYLFSCDVELLVERERIGRIPGGYRMNLRARSDTSRVYHVARASSVAGVDSPAITGRLQSGTEELLLRSDDVAISRIRTSIITDAGTVIHMTYSVVASLGPGVARRLIGGRLHDLLGTEKVPVVAPLMILPRFSVADPTYRWLNECQGIGFGQLQLVRSTPRRLTCDIYALS